MTAERRGLKVFATIVLACVLMGVVVVFATSCDFFGGDSYDLIKASDIVLPKNIDTDNKKLYGLYFYNDDYTTMKRSTETDVNFDPEKPTIIFIHGMQMNYGYHTYDPIDNVKGWMEGGYNYGVYLWSQLADCSFPSIGKTRIWGRDNTFFYADENDKRQEETVDKFNYSTAELFVAYYFDLMQRVGDYKGSSITIAGHSLGANTNFAIGHCMKTLYEHKKISKQYLPDRFVYLDAYMDSENDQKTIIPWLNEPIGEGGVIKRAQETVTWAHSVGIATEYLKSFTFVSYLADMEMYGGKPGTCDQLFDKVLFTDMNDPKTAAELIYAHVNSYHWYFDAFSYPDVYDNSVTASGVKVLGYGPKTPISVTYARNYFRYSMPALDGEHQFSTNITKPKIAGFAFVDKNDNGINDDRVNNRYDGVKVELYKGDTKIATTKTEHGGYYEFEVDDFAGKEYRVKAILPGKKTFAKESDGGYMNNGVDADGYSSTFSFRDKVEIKIVNIGIESVAKRK